MTDGEILERLDLIDKGIRHLRARGRQHEMIDDLEWASEQLRRKILPPVEKNVI